MTAATVPETALDADALAERAARITVDLADLLDRETKAVRALAFDGLDEVIKAKQSLLDAYEAEAGRLAALGDGGTALDPAVAERLRDANGRLQTAAAANGRALEVARAAGGRIVGMIVETARRAQHGPTSYGANGRTAASRDAAVSLRLNQTL
jgi:flagellar biosynthesis/type III secretory pathway chaperone